MMEVRAPSGMQIRYLRRKPGKGLVIVYEPRPHGRWITLTVDEAGLARRRAPAPERCPVPSDDGVAMQVFPSDGGLPGLSECCAPAAGAVLFRALENAARIQLCDQAWNLLCVQPEPVRYKPASRCVIRYRLLLKRSAPGPPSGLHLILFGKIYNDPEQARTVHDRALKLYAEQATAGQPLIPRPLDIVPDLGIVLNEGIEYSGFGELRTGSQLLQPGYVRAPGGGIAYNVPTRELRLTAAALARLHTTAAAFSELPRTAAQEARRVRERAALIGRRYPAQAETVEHTGERLASCLERIEPDAYRPAHGGFKPSQLLFRSERVFVVDLDGLCSADPALDAGYFLAYLRPAGLWYGRPAARQWFEESAAIFLDAYRDALAEQGIDEGVIKGILERRRLYEAALLFKIATRRVNRLNSPRPGELAAMLAETASLMRHRE
jgi:hypothetical protein